MIPKDARTWIERQRDELEPAHPFVRFGVNFDGGTTCPPASTSHDDVNQRAHERALTETLEFVRWIAFDSRGHHFGYWLGPEHTPLKRASSCVAVPNGTLFLLPGQSMTAALTHFYGLGERATRRVAELCTNAGLELDLSADTTTWPAAELQPEAIYEARFRAAERAFGQS